MTAAILSIALVLTPAPITAPKEPATWQSLKVPATTAAFVPTTSSWPPEILGEAESLFAPTESPVLSVEPPEPPPILSPIELGMNRLAELGATPYQLRVFGCLAWFESKNNPYAVSATGDHGWLQINAYYHRWRWAGRDIYDTVVNAEVAWDIYQGSGFRAWTTARLCGV